MGCAGCGEGLLLDEGLVSDWLDERFGVLCEKCAVVTHRTA
jgi:hypothetical protein